MAKANAKKVIPAIAEEAIKTGKDMGYLYSECVLSSYRMTGNLSCGFDAKDLIAWIRETYPNLYDEKGKRKEI